MFNQANVENRLRHSVRGRVIGFTNSTSIEFLGRDLEYSFPLYSTDGYSEASGIGFCVELDGFLTFEPGSEVKIQEVGPYVGTAVSLHSFWMVRPADPYSPTLITVNGLYAGGMYNGIELGYYTGRGNTGSYQLYQFSIPEPVHPNDFAAWVESKSLNRNPKWLGVTGYPFLNFVRQVQ